MQTYQPGDQVILFIPDSFDYHIWSYYFKRDFGSDSRIVLATIKSVGPRGAIFDSNQNDNTDEVWYPWSMIKHKMPSNPFKEM